MSTTPTSVSSISSDTKIKNTLFRFVTLRKPEQIDDDKKLNLFVHHPNFEASILFAANVAAFKTKLTEFETTPVGALKNAEALKLINPELFKFSDWVLRNRVNLTPESIAQKRNETEISILTDDEEKNIWDNFIYQVSTKKDVLAREVAMTMLYGNYLLKNAFTVVTSVVSAITYDAVEKTTLRRILQARIVVPSHILYKDEQVNNTGARVASSTTAIDVKTQLQFNKNSSQLDSQAFLEDLQVLSKELTKFRKNHQKAEALNRKEYDIAYQALLETYYTDYPSTDDETPPVTPVPPIPAYNYISLVEIDLAKIEDELTPDSFELFNLIGASEADTQEEVIQIIQKKFTELSQNLFDGKQLSRKYNAYKGVILPASSERVSDIITYGCSPRYRPISKKLRINLSISFGDASVSITNIDYRLLQDGAVIGESNLASFTPNINGVIGIGLFANGLTLQTTDNLSLRVFFKLNTGGEYLFTQPIVVNVDSKGQITSAINDGEEDDIKVKYGITRLGIAEYKKVEQSICCYVPGEVSHIENVMAREYKEKATKRLRRSENTTTTESSTETENLTDTTSTERNEMHQEISKMQQQSIDLSVNAGAYYNGAKNRWGVTLNAGFAYNNSKEESNNMAKTEAKELTERAMERVVTKVREERINKIIDEFTDENKHGFDNREGSEHVSGVYRWVDKIYKNQILNYGKRLMYEFMIPEPAFLHLRYLQEDENKNLAVLVKPLDPRENGLTNTFDVNVSTYEKWASVYNAEVEAPPQDYMFVGKAYSGGAESNGGKGSATKDWNDLVIPEGYIIESVKFSYEHKRKTGTGVTDANSHTRSYVQIGNKSKRVGLIYTGPTEGDFKHGYSAFIEGANPLRPREFTLDNSALDPILPINQNTVPVSVVTWDVSSFSLNVNAKTIRTPELYKKWQIETFNAIIQAYEDKLAIYEQKVADVKSLQAEYKETNPLFYREIENLILRKNCIAYMLKSADIGLDFQKGDKFNTHYIDQTSVLEEYASRVKFMEQAFEWEIMSYIFYPFYWGKNERWASLYGQDTADKLFTKFLQSGMGRVILSVRPGFEDAVTWFLETGEVWNGASTAPVIDDDLYLSIVDELQEPEYTVEGSWETRIPSTLTVIQDSGVGLHAEGLPCACKQEIKEEFSGSTNTLEGATSEGGVGYWKVNADENQTPPIYVPNPNPTK